MNSSVLMADVYNLERGSKEPYIMNKYDCLKKIIKFKKILNTKDFTNLIESNKDILNGKKVIKGTRITPETIFKHIYLNINKAQKDINSLLSDYPNITESQYMDAVLYYIKTTSIIKLLFLK